MTNLEQMGYLRKLRREMDSMFNLSEFKTLCFDLRIDYEHLAGESDNKLIKIQSLIHYMGRHGRFYELIELLKEVRPDIQIPDIPESEVQIQQDIESIEPVKLKPDGKLVAVLTTLLLFVLCGYLGAFSLMDDGGIWYFFCVPVFLFAAIYGFIMASQYRSKRAKVISIALGISSIAHIIYLLVIFALS